MENFDNCLNLVNNRDYSDQATFDWNSWIFHQHMMVKLGDYRDSFHDNSFNRSSIVKTMREKKDQSRIRVRTDFQALLFAF